MIVYMEIEKDQPNTNSKAIKRLVTDIIGLR